MRNFKYIIALLVFATPSLLFADLKFYLYPKAKVVSDKKLTLKDIALIEGRSDFIDKMKDAEIPASLYSDGYVDRKEVLYLAGEISDEVKLIYGNSVRVKMPDKEDVKDSAVTKGETVDVIIKRRGITIETIGVSLVDAIPGDKIQVEVKGKKILNGILKEDRIVEVSL